jgi:hypothetical protein
MQPVLTPGTNAHFFRFGASGLKTSWGKVHPNFFRVLFVSFISKRGDASML